MARYVRLGELLLGVEGVAVMRELLTGSDADIGARVREIARISREIEDPPLSLGLEMPEADVREGYRIWSATYDQATNPLIAIEEPVVRSMVADLAPGRALDAACGTGRHAAHLAAAGHEVVGVDGSPEMLARASDKVAGARFLLGDLAALPLGDRSVDLAVCALALDHSADVGPAIRELARVVRAGGRVILSDAHPFGVLIGGRAVARGADGRTVVVRGVVHPHGEYLAAFAAAGLAVRRCLEPLYEPEHVEMLEFLSMIPEAARAAYVGMPGALVWDLARA